MTRSLIKLALCATFCLALLSAGAAELVWHTSLPKALRIAKAEKRLVLMEFTGSDWCRFCLKLDSEVFHTVEFKDYARKNLVLVEIDFPTHKLQPAELKQANEALKHQYAIRGYPTLLILDSEGKKLGELVGYSPGSGAKTVIGRINSFKRK